MKFLSFQMLGQREKSEPRPNSMTSQNADRVLLSLQSLVELMVSKAIY